MKNSIGLVDMYKYSILRNQLLKIRNDIIYMKKGLLLEISC